MTAAVATSPESGLPLAVGQQVELPWGLLTVSRVLPAEEREARRIDFEAYAVPNPGCAHYLLPGFAYPTVWGSVEIVAKPDGPSTGRGFILTRCQVGGGGGGDAADPVDQSLPLTVERSGRRLRITIECEDVIEGEVLFQRLKRAIAAGGLTFGPEETLHLG